MKIVTFNVNGLRPRAKEAGGIKQLLDSFDADIICFQETKVGRSDLTADVAIAEGYESFFAFTRGKYSRSPAGYSGVATFCRTGGLATSCSPVLPVAADEGFTGVLHLTSNGRSGLVAEELREEDRVGYYEGVWKGGENDYPPSRIELEELDGEGRCVVTDHGSFVLFNVYGPCVQPDDEARMRYKWTFYETMQRRWEPMLAAGRRVILLGDLNIAPARIDSCKAGPDFDASRSRQWLQAQLIANGGPFQDIFRHLHPTRDDVFTCFSTATGAASFNYGSRIDLILAAGPCTCSNPPFPSPHETPSPKQTSPASDSSSGLTLVPKPGRLSPGAVPKLGHPENDEPAPKLRHSFAMCEFLECQVAAHLAGSSDHRPVAAEMVNQADLANHKVPSLSTRHMPELRGKQTRLLGFFNSNSSRSLGLEGSPSPPLLTSSARTVSQDDETRRLLSLSAGTSGQGATKGTLKRKGDTGKGVQSSLKSFFSLPRQAKGIDEEIVAEPVGVESCLQSSSHIKASQAVERMAGEALEEVQGLSREGLSEREGLLESELEESSKSTGAAAEWAKIRAHMAAAVPRCMGHGEVCAFRVVKKAGPNLGRGFYVCARAQGPSDNPEARCDHFAWHTSKAKPIPPSAFLKQYSDTRDRPRGTFEPSSKAAKRPKR